MPQEFSVYKGYFMSFVSLCSTKNQIYGKIPKDTFEDIKLTELFEKNVLGVMQYLPTEKDILLRQEVFTYLENESILDFYTELLFDLRSLAQSFEAFENALIDEEKQYIFCDLLYKLCLFYEKASKEKAPSGFLKEFSDNFAKICETEEYKKAKEDSQWVYNEFFEKLTLFTESSKLIIHSDTEEGYISRIEKCARDMGIDLRECDYLPRRITPELTKLLSTLYNGLWEELSKLYSRYISYPEKDLLLYIDQLDFYISVYKVMQRVKEKGIPLCFAKIHPKESIRILTAHDITLFSKECENIIPNDILFDTKDPFFFLSGANGGGKTTYLRTCGVNTVFSLLGCPVPAKSSHICMLDSIGTHFPRDERFDSDGRFLDEQKRVDTLIDNMGKRSLVLLNETYSTTNEAKAARMTVALTRKLYAEKQFGVYVTHQKSVLKEDIPLLACKVDKDDENKRTYKIERINSIGSSYAEDVLKKYALSRADLEERFGEL